MKKLVPLIDKFATFCKFVEDGRAIRCVIISRSDEFALLRPVHEFHRIIRCRTSQLFEAFQ